MRFGVAYRIVGGDLVWEVRRASDAELVASGSIPQGGSPYERILASSPFYGGFYILLWAPDPNGVVATPADLCKVDVVAGTSTKVGSILATNPHYANVGCNLDGSEARCFLIDEDEAVSTRMAYSGGAVSFVDIPLPNYGRLMWGDIMETPSGRLYLAADQSSRGLYLYTSGDQGETWEALGEGAPSFKYAYGELTDFVGSTSDGGAPKTMVSPTESQSATWGELGDPVTTIFNSLAFGSHWRHLYRDYKTVSIKGGIYRSASLDSLLLDLSEDEPDEGSGTAQIGVVSYSGDIWTYSFDDGLWFPKFFIPYGPGTRPTFWTALRGTTERP